MILLQMFSYPFMQRALIAGVLVSLCCALLGVSLVLKRYSMIGDGLSHVSFGALAIAVALTMGEKDIVVPSYMVMENFNALPNAKLLPYENCGHSPMVDCPDRLAADVKEFFQ